MLTPPPSKRLYFRNLPKYVNHKALAKHLSSYGKITEVKLVHDYAFVEFQSQKDAQDVVETFRKRPFLGQDIVVEFARPLHKNTLSVEGNISTDTIPSVLLKPRLTPANVQCRYPVVVSNIPRKIRWQELKDFGRISGGFVAYCDLDKRQRGRGFIEYFSKEDAERAILELDNTLLGGQRVRVSGRPEIFSRRPARSRSPEGRARSPRQWSNDDRRDMHPNDYYHLRTNDYEYYHRGSSPPAYHYESPAYRYYSQYRFPARHRSPHCALDEAGMASSHSYLATGVDHEPEQYEEQYDYASRGLTLEAWKYDYDHVVGHITDQWNAPCEQVPGSQQPNNF